MYYNRIVVIDVINMTYSITYISETLSIDGFDIAMYNDKTLIVDSYITLTNGCGHRVRLHFSAPIEKFERMFKNIYVRYCDKPSYINESRIKFYLKDGTMRGYSICSFKYPNGGLEHINENGKEVETMAAKKNETKVTAVDEEVSTESAKKEEPTPREVISQYAEAYDNMTKDAIRGNNVFGFLSPAHRLSIAAHLDQIVEILESYIGK